MKNLRGIVIVMVSMILSANIYIRACAEETDMLEGIGSVSIRVLDEEKYVSGGSLTLYPVAGVKENAGEYVFEYTRDWEKCMSDLEDFQSGELAKELELHATRHAIQGETALIEKDGTVVFENLKAGLYLISQKEAVAEYEKINPFLVVLPVKVGNEWVYDVDASPKVDLEKEDSTTGKTPGTTGDRLPQTGQMNWPIPVLAISGMALFTIGWILCFGKKDRA